MRTIIAIDYGKYTDNEFLTEDNIDKVREHVKDLKWSYVVKGDCLFEDDKKSK